VVNIATVFAKEPNQIGMFLALPDRSGVLHTTMDQWSNLYYYNRITLASLSENKFTKHNNSVQVSKCTRNGMRASGHGCAHTKII
jgi:hypothetical protein